LGRETDRVVELISLFKIARRCSALQQLFTVAASSTTTAPLNGSSQKTVTTRKDERTFSGKLDEPLSTLDDDRIKMRLPICLKTINTRYRNKSTNDSIKH
jgi:hypothetical protein